MRKCSNAELERRRSAALLIPCITLATRDAVVSEDEFVSSQHEIGRVVGASDSIGTDYLPLIAPPRPHTLGVAGRGAVLRESGLLELRSVRVGGRLSRVEDAGELFWSLCVERVRLGENKQDAEFRPVH